MGGPQSPGGPGLARALDAALDASVVGGFSRLGYLLRRGVERWGPPPGIPGANAVVVGASSGIGRAIAVGLAAAGAEVCLVGRDERRLAEAAAAADRARVAGSAGSAGSGGNGRPARTASVDVTDAVATGAFVRRLADEHDRLTVLVHAAGNLLRRHTVVADGTEATVATHVLAPFRLTLLLAPLLRAGGGRIVTVSSGGMYLARLDVARLDPGPAAYDGRRAYALAKRAQVVLADLWADRLGGDVASYAQHPGWVDTPGLASGLPGFTHLGPLLRRPDEGADTAVWLAAGGALPERRGFYHDRHRRSLHRLPATTMPPATAAAEAAALWGFCAERTGLGADT